MKKTGLDFFLEKSGVVPFEYREPPKTQAELEEYVMNPRNGLRNRIRAIQTLKRDGTFAQYVWNSRSPRFIHLCLVMGTKSRACPLLEKHHYLDKASALRAMRNRFGDY